MRPRRPWRVVLLLGVLLVAGCSPTQQRALAGRPGPLPTRPAPPDAAAGEQFLPGSADWRVNHPAGVTRLAGYTSPASALPGSPVALHLRSRQRDVIVRVFRSGWYGGAGARQVWQAKVQVPPPGPPVLVDAGTRTWAANWAAELTLRTRGWAPGAYLVLASSRDGQTWIPFTLRSPAFAGRVVILSANTTWQAYNAWGGRSLYHGPDGSFRSRAYAVSFDRPYDYGTGAADFIGNERPLIGLAERLRLPLAFAADTDLQTAPGLLAGARAVISLGHDEYWSSAMRAQLTQARAHGTNLAFLGANAIYRHIRLGPLASGRNRLETDYKDGTLDPVARTHPAEGTWDWPKGPLPRDGAELTGGHYACNPVHASMIVTDPRSWLFRGLGLRPGQPLPGLVGSEYDAVRPGGGAPPHLVSMARSPVTCRGRPDHADLVYYTTPGGAAGLDVGTSSWVCVLDQQCQYSVTPLDVRVITAVTTRILREFAKGPAGRSHPAPGGSVSTLRVAAG